MMIGRLESKIFASKETGLKMLSKRNDEIETKCN